MQSDEKKRIAEFCAAFGRDCTVQLRAADDPRSQQLQRFCDQLAEAGCSVCLAQGEDAPQGLPAIAAGRGIFFHGVPLGRELEPFLDALVVAGSGRPASPHDEELYLQDSTLPVALKLYVSQRCPHCPVVIRRIATLAAANAGVELHVIDADLFSELAQQDGIRAVPTLVLNADFRWTGQVPLKELTAAMADRDPGRMGPGMLQNMLQAGEARRAAALMLASGEVPPALIELLLHPDWPIRLAAMVTVEWMAEEDRCLAARTVAMLWQRMGDVENTVRGDIVYLAGEYGKRDLLPELAALKASCPPGEMRDAVCEALEKLNNT